jgi:hypothetical protein
MKCVKEKEQHRQSGRIEDLKENAKNVVNGGLCLMPMLQ